MIELISTCVQATALEVEAYDKTESIVELQSVKSMIDILDYYTLAKSLGYALQKKGGLMMHEDWHISFGLGEFRGEKVICVHHSAIHHFFRFTPKETIPQSLARPRFMFIDGERQKYCKGCDEYHPATKEFFYGVRKNDEKALEALCKPCYNERYKKPKRLTNKTYALKDAA